MNELDILFFLNNGHGSVVWYLGELYYVTPGKRSVKIPPGVYEGLFNRSVVESASEYMDDYNLAHHVIAPGPIDIPLGARCGFANKVHRHFTKVKPDNLMGSCYLSVHGNAAGMGRKWNNKAKGLSIHVHPFATKSKEYAKLMEEEIMFQMDGMITSRGIKYNKHLFELFRTSMPAMIIETEFMTHELQAELMASDLGQWGFGKGIANGARRITAYERVLAA